MSAVSIQKTCAACAGELGDDALGVKLECLIDEIVRYVAVHTGCSVYTPKMKMKNIESEDESNDERCG